MKISRNEEVKKLVINSARDKGACQKDLDDSYVRRGQEMGHRGPSLFIPLIPIPNPF